MTTAQDVRGHFDSSGRYVDASDARDREWRFEARAITKVAQQVQLGVIVPYLRTERRFADSASAGSGVGDLTIFGRYDFVRVGGQNGWPGVAFTFGLTAPTGRPPDRARDTLATDVTGTGAWEAKPGIAIEKIWWTGWFVSGAISGGFFTTHKRDDGSTIQLGPRLQSFLAAGKSFTWGFQAALGITHEQEAGPRVDSLRVGASGARTSALAFVSYELDDHWQLLASGLVDFAGREQFAATTISLGVRRAWNVY